MTSNKEFDIIIIGGSYAGLSAAMSLGRSLRKVLIIDAGNPCNRQTPYSHNFITQDGNTPAAIAASAKQQVQKYDTVEFYNGLATNGHKSENGFTIETQSGEIFTSKKLIIASGIKDIMPEIKGFAECWGISIIHCPYCHGYEVRNEKTGILGNGDYGYEFSKMISNWTKDLTLFTNGPSTLTYEQASKLKDNNIRIVETEVAPHVEHENGHIRNLIFKDNSKESVKALYSKNPFVQSTEIPMTLGCELTEHGFLKVDAFQKTNVYGVFACGDNTSFMRSVASAVSTGNLAGVMANRELIDESF